MPARAIVVTVVLSGALFVAWGDSLPRLPYTVHSDPFLAGWPAPVVPPPGPGVVIPGNGAPPDPEYHLLGPGAIDGFSGVDNYVSTGYWHWELELDLNPYGAQPGALWIRFDLRPIGGPLLGYYDGEFVAGPDVYVDFRHPDATMATGDVGPFSKSLRNDTPAVVAWGMSLTEREPAALGPYPVFLWQLSTQDSWEAIPVVMPTPTHQRFTLTHDGANFWTLSIPEPSTAVLAAGLAALLGRRARRGR
ncbi:MAG: hypothetical protein IPM13_03775 [Phycisphaerales bacterium]|nr:hypothetical protein [Phycisphaerales bacterium]